MIDKDKFHVLNYVRKEEYTGSMDGMRYMLKKKEKEDGSALEVIIWPEPYCFSKTEEEKKQGVCLYPRGGDGGGGLFKCGLSGAKAGLGEGKINFILLFSGILFIINAVNRRKNGWGK